MSCTPAFARRALLPLALAAGLAAGPTAVRAGETGGMIVYASDFGLRDGAVAAMKGVALGVDPRLRLFDLTHEIPPFDIWTGAYHLDATLPYWPKGTVFVAVVDPGVGTERGAVAARTTSGHYVVGPDNGLLTFVAEEPGVAAVRTIDAGRHRLPGSEASHTFHGRDLFSITAAKLASGRITFEEVGPARDVEVVRIPYQRAEARDGKVVGIIPIHDTNFGNVWTNVDRRTFETLGLKHGDAARVRILDGEDLVYEDTIPFVDTFGDVPEGEALLYLNSLDRVALALNLGDFASVHGIGYGAGWRVEIARP